MRPSIIRAVLTPDMPATSATIGVALGLLGTISSDIAKDLTTARHALGQRRRPQHDEILAETITHADSLAYVARWIAARIRAAKHEDDLPIVIMGVDEDAHHVAAPARSPDPGSAS